MFFLSFSVLRRILLFFRLKAIKTSEKAGNFSFAGIQDII